MIATRQNVAFNNGARMVTYRVNMDRYNDVGDDYDVVNPYEVLAMAVRTAVAYEEVTEGNEVRNAVIRFRRIDPHTGEERQLHASFLRAHWQDGDSFLRRIEDLYGWGDGEGSDPWVVRDIWDAGPQVLWDRFDLYVRDNRIRQGIFRQIRTRRAMEARRMGGKFVSPKPDLLPYPMIRTYEVANAHDAQPGLCVVRMAAAVEERYNLEQHWVPEHPLETYWSDDLLREWETWLDATYEGYYEVVRLDPYRVKIDGFDAYDWLKEWDGVMAWMEEQEEEFCLDKEEGILDACAWRDYLQVKAEWYEYWESMNVGYIEASKRFIIPAEELRLQKRWAPHQIVLAWQPEHVELVDLSEDREIVMTGHYYVTRDTQGSVGMFVAGKSTETFARAKWEMPDQKGALPYRHGLKKAVTATQLKTLDYVNLDRLYVSIDYETHVDPGSDRGQFVANTLSAAWATENQMRKMNIDWDFLFSSEGYDQKKQWKGPECGVEFWHWLLFGDDAVSRKYREVVIVTYNGANFDHKFLMEDFLSTRNLLGCEQPKIKGLHKTKGSLISFDVGNVGLFDICLHLHTSLAGAAKDFGVPAEYRKIEGATSHDTVQRIVDTYPEWDMWHPEHPEAEQMSNYADYALMDAMCTMVLFRNWWVDGLGQPDWSKVRSTVGSQAYHEVKEWWTGEEFQDILEAAVPDKKMREKLNLEGVLEKIPPDLYYAWRRDLIGGRVNLEGDPFVTEGEQWVSADVKSMYPGVMLKLDHFLGRNQWPVGVATRVENPTELTVKLESREGMYLVDMDQGPIWRMFAFLVHPYKETKMKMTPLGEEKEIPMANHWFPDLMSEAQPEEFAKRQILRRVWLPSASVRMCLKLGGKILTWHDAYEWVTVPGVDLWRPLLKWMKGKNEEDAKKNQGLPHNAAKRNYLKRLSNSTSGRMIMRSYDERTLMIELSALDSTIQREEESFYRRVDKMYPEDHPLRDRQNDGAPGFGGHKVLHAVRGFIAGRHGTAGSPSYAVVSRCIDKRTAAMQQSPMVYGLKIYAESRMYMLWLMVQTKVQYRLVFRKMPEFTVRYGDTDSFQGTMKMLEPFIAWAKTQTVRACPEYLRHVPEEEGDLLWGNSTYGQLEDEYEDLKPEQMKAAYAGRKLKVVTDGRKTKLSAKGVGRKDVWFRDRDEALYYVNGMRQAMESKDRELWVTWQKKLANRYHFAFEDERFAMCAYDALKRAIVSRGEKEYCLSFFMKRYNGLAVGKIVIGQDADWIVDPRVGEATPGIICAIYTIKSFKAQGDDRDTMLRLEVIPPPPEVETQYWRTVEKDAKSAILDLHPAPRPRTPPPVEEEEEEEEEVDSEAEFAEALAEGWVVE